MANRALLVIDAQNVYTSPDSELHCKGAPQTIARINEVVSDARRRGDLIVVVRHVHKADGSDLGRMFDYLGEAEEDFNFKDGTTEVDLDSALELPQKRIEITKTRYSAFVGTNLHETLQSRKVDSVTICGFMTNFCCEGTARQAHDLDYFVDFIADATGTPGTDNQSQSELRTRVADTLKAGYARTWTTKRWCSRP
jgi:nicotinamidase-related amidase